MKENGGKKTKRLTVIYVIYILPSFRMSPSLQRVYEVQSSVPNKDILLTIAAKTEKKKNKKVKKKKLTSKTVTNTSEQKIPKITQSWHSIETGEHQYMQPNGVEKCKSPSIPATMTLFVLQEINWNRICFVWIHELELYIKYAERNEPRQWVKLSNKNATIPNYNTILAL